MNRTFLDRLDGTQHCRNADLRLFFPTTLGPSNARAAKALCRRCPFQPACLAYALAHDLHGVWGGATRDERRAYQRARHIDPIPVPHHREKR